MQTKVKQQENILSLPASWRFQLQGKAISEVVFPIVLAFSSLSYFSVVCSQYMKIEHTHTHTSAYTLFAYIYALFPTTYVNVYKFCCSLCFSHFIFIFFISFLWNAQHSHILMFSSQSLLFYIFYLVVHFIFFLGCMNECQTRTLIHSLLYFNFTRLYYLIFKQ